VSCTAGERGMRAPVLWSYIML